MDDSSSALVFSTNDILGNGYATHVRKFSFTAAGPHRVRIKAFKDNKAVIFFICPRTYLKCIVLTLSTFCRAKIFSMIPLIQ